MRFCERPYRYIYTDGYGRIGDVIICQWMKNSPARVIGNLFDNELHEIWHGKRAYEIRKSFEDQSFRYCEKMSCPYLEKDSLPDISEEEFAQRAVAKEYPDQFNIAHDLICNHKCPSCRNEVFNGGERYSETIREINSKLLPFLNKAEVISACGLGDAFSSPYMMDLLSSLYMERKNAHITLETNGVFCDIEHWNRLANLHNCSNITVGVTPNSFERSTYKYLSGGFDDLERVEKNMLLLKELRAEGRIKSFYITIVVQESNFRELPSFVDRALNEYKANNVVIRTIYKWNKLSAEDYWFKDVMNPLHPYHNDMLQVMAEPILKDSRVYNWTNFNEHTSAEHPAYRYKEYLEITKEIIKQEGINGGLAQKLKNRGIFDVIVYGDNDLADIIIDILTKSKYPIRYQLARDYCNCNDRKIDTVALNEYVPSKNDSVVISNYMDLGYIQRDLEAIGFSGRLITIKELYR